ncbi:hypothetical protein EBS02_03525, partial [bacterium]|nr:hypothetical protein [bacterium]
ALLAQNKGKSHSLIRFKGLGEMNPAQLRSTTLDPQSRLLIRLNYDPNSYENLDLLMAKNRAADRKKWLEEPQSDFISGAVHD